MKRLLALAMVVGWAAGAAAQRSVPPGPQTKAESKAFHDKHYGVRFDVPPGWQFSKKDREVSTFHLDARSASEKSEMRGVASIGFNPYPLSTFSGAMFYYSVQKHVNDRDCEEQASKFSTTEDTLKIGGMDFVHGHDQHGEMCVEARDEVYTAYRKGACYRFDLEVNTFCAASSGALEMTRRQYNDIEHRMQLILGSVKLDWKPERAVPELPSKNDREPRRVPEPQGPPVSGMQTFR